MPPILLACNNVINQIQRVTQTFEKEQTASEAQLRYESHVTALAHERLSEHPHLQAEAIAKHYVAHATTALQLLKLVECRRYSGSYPELDRCIQMLVDEIKTNHRHDFGIELEWPK